MYNIYILVHRAIVVDFFHFFISSPVSQSLPRLISGQCIQYTVGQILYIESSYGTHNFVLSFITPHICVIPQ